MRVSSTDRSNFSGVAAKPGANAYISQGMPISARTVSSSRMNSRPANASSAKDVAACVRLVLEALGKHRHERRVERALAEQAAKQIGKSKGHEERIGDCAGAQRGGDENVADKAEHAADHGQPADGGEGTVEVHGRRGLADGRDKSKAQRTRPRCTEPASAALVTGFAYARLARPARNARHVG